MYVFVHASIWVYVCVFQRERLTSFNIENSAFISTQSAHINAFSVSDARVELLLT